MGGFRWNFDCSVYFVADPAQCADRDIRDVVAAAIKGGATLIQLRNKTDRLPVITAQARDLLTIARAGGVPLIINDYLDIAFNIGADGVHLGQGDTPVADARAVLGRDKIVGLTAFTPAQIAAVDPDIIDYIGTGPFFPTQTDKGKPVLGAEKFAALAASASVPVVGIGGITAETAADVICAGARGVAVMRAISAAADPEAAARALSAAVHTARFRAAS